MKHGFGMLCRAGMVFTLAVICTLLPCAFAAGVNMPFNGDVRFHGICVTVPDSYIRDSTQSNADFYLFEKGWFSSVIMLSREDAPDDTEEWMNGYMEYLLARGAHSERTKFLGMRALESQQLRGGVLWQEMYFACGDSLYAVAISGGDEEEFRTLLDTVRIDDGSGLAYESVPKEDTNILDRILRYFG